MSARLSGDREAGFTLIELLVVMLILGILAAIAIPAFFNQREKGTDAQAKAAVRTAQTAIETYATENAGSYKNADKDALVAIEPTLGDATELIVLGEMEGGEPKAATEPGLTTYAVGVKSDTDTIFTIERSGGAVTFGCSELGKGGCPDDEGEGDWSK
jgi:type IV pilus assembly protein PilA